MDSLGDRLKRLRQQRGLTQEDIGREFNVVKQTVSNWENDVALPDLLTFDKLAQFYGVSYCYLQGRTDSSVRWDDNCAVREDAVSSDRLTAHDRMLLDKFHLLLRSKQWAIEVLLGMKPEADASELKIHKK